MNQFSQFVMHHWPLWVAFVILILLVFANELMSQKKKAQEISPQTAIDLINNENAVIIDLRDKEAFKNGHIIDAVNANADDFNQSKMDKYKEKNLILICARGQQSPMVAAKIKALGFKPRVLSGGIASWQNADLPLVKNKG
ncbi:rhodanese-like domain-containing protein [Legionella sp. km772]|uniref:rhodanese-like domain-containing protein n=1 Tax=Legionella sp. km772 TaxID=2498111 RepID=UPI000F8ED2B2|nr:rhodanese-like domain-containing protein [Legionella sp. km772]RUR09288.1 rhodanese-like domain-containing protein [Legionella sp. km772]